MDVADEALGDASQDSHWTAARRRGFVDEYSAPPVGLNSSESKLELGYTVTEFHSGSSLADPRPEAPAEEGAARISRVTSPPLETVPSGRHS
jgi:hypothetical protein